MITTDCRRDPPELIHTEAELDAVLTQPSQALVDFIKTLSSPLVILGAGGKMGPTLAVLARRAAAEAHHALEVIAVSRFSDISSRRWLEEHEVKTISCDLLEPESFSRVPEAENAVCLVGLKFGTEKNAAATWVTNTVVPARIAERYPQTRMVALSTGNVYPLTDASRGGASETDALTPIGEYPNAAVGRERVLEFYSRRNGTALALLRLFYAVELRYGVIADIAQKIYSSQPIPLANGYFNCIWQGDANEMILRALSLAGSPPTVWNLCHPEVFAVRATAIRLGELLDRPVSFEGSETSTALLGNAAQICAKLGRPAISIEAVLRWTADWIKQSGRNLGRPTHFEVRDGNY